MKAIIWDEASQGMKFDVRATSRPSCSADAEKWREKMVEAAAEANEELMNKYLETGELTEDEIKHGMRTRTIAGEIQPMLCGTAFKNKGVQRMLDAVIDFMPSPIDIPPVPGTDDDDKPVDAPAPTTTRSSSALAFKLMTDPYVGQLTFVRVYSGVLKSGDSVYNPIRGKKERIGRILQMHANQREEIKEILRRRHRRLRRPEGRDHRRDAVRSGRDHHAREDGLPGAGDLAGRRAEDQGRPGKDGHRARAAWRRKTRRSACSTDEESRPDHHLRHGRAAPRDHRRPHEARVRRRGQRRQAAGGLPRDDPQAGRRDVEGKFVTPVGRQGPVRPRRAARSSRRSRARASSSSTRSRAAWCRANSSRRSRRASRTRCRTACWPATRWSTSRSR